MSDFLSKFEQPVSKRSASEPGAQLPPLRGSHSPAAVPSTPAADATAATAAAAAATAELPSLRAERSAGRLTNLPALASTASAGAVEGSTSYAASDRAGIAPVEHEVSLDGGYKRKRTIRILVILLAVVLVGAAAFLVYTASQRVVVPDFIDKPLTEAQTWARDNNLELVISEEFSLEVEEGLIMAQELEADSSTTRGSQFALTVSSGPDPDELLSLPDFSQLTMQEAKKWIDENKATNLRIVQEFSEDVPKDAYIKLVFRNETTTGNTYKRKDYASLYYSKGPEVFEKNIEVPDFKGKTQFEAESWAETNSITLEIEEATSSNVPMGSIISQSIPAKEKVAKKDTLSIVVSLGKAVIVPNFADYDAQTAAGASPGLMVNVKTRFSMSVPYGKLISQSVGAGAGILPDEDVTVTVVYSEGQPYLKNYSGMNEGELAALFWQDYTSKGAEVTYSVKYVDSSEVRGTVVSMSNYNVYIPLEYHVVIYVSNGKLPAPAPPTPSP